MGHLKKLQRKYEMQCTEQADTVIFAWWAPLFHNYILEWLHQQYLFCKELGHKQNLALGAVAVAKAGTKLQCHKSEIMSHSLLLNAALVSLFAFMQARGHAAVVIIIFMVRGGLEGCLITVNYTGIAQVWDLGPALEYYLICKDGNLQNHINIGGFAPWSPEILLFLSSGSKGKDAGMPHSGFWCRFEEDVLSWCRRAALLGSSTSSPASHKPAPHNFHPVKTCSTPHYFTWGVTPSPVIWHLPLIFIRKI